MAAPLISASWRAPLIGVCGAAAVGFAALSIALAHTRSTAFDDWTFRQLYEHVGRVGADVLLVFSLPAVSIGLIGVVTVLAVLRRRWDVAALAVAGTGIAVLLAEWVFKPLVRREIGTPGDYGTAAFPSGHEAGVAAAALVLLIVAYQRPMSRRARVGIAAVLAAWVLAAAAGLVRNLYHYATDTVGAILLCGAVVPAVALTIDAVGTAMTKRATARREVLVRQ